MLGAVADLDQLMIVLGHEMAHAILDHSVYWTLCSWCCFIVFVKAI